MSRLYEKARGVMAVYFNPGNESYRSDKRSQVYVDKTGLLSYLNTILGTNNRCVAVSHARRFGKSQAAGMIDAYYSMGSDSRELFSDLEIAKDEHFEEHLNKYNVIHLDISSIFDYYQDNLVEKIIECIIYDLKEEYGDRLDYSRPFTALLMDVYHLSGRPFVIIIDEWECIIRNSGDDELIHRYLQFLHSLFKSEESKHYLALGYITGIMPIKKIKNESALNNFKEYTMLDSYPITQYYGFTEHEVKELCDILTKPENAIIKPFSLCQLP